MDIQLVVIMVATALMSFKGFNDPAFFSKYMFQVAPIKRNREYLRLLSSGFLHADLMHLLFNMFTLYFFAPIVLAFFGQIGFFVIYFGAILAGNLFSLYIYRDKPMYSAIGASGGVSGVLFAAIAMNPFLGIGILFIPIPIPGYIFGLIYFGYSVYMMLNPKEWDRLGHAAHLGGAAVGLLVALLFFPANTAEHFLQLLIMSLPLLYLAFQLVIKKKI